mgnify:CR=1 FL=1
MRGNGVSKAPDEIHERQEDALRAEGQLGPGELVAEEDLMAFARAADQAEGMLDGKAGGRIVQHEEIHVQAVEPVAGDAPGPARPAVMLSRSEASLLVWESLSL